MTSEVVAGTPVQYFSALSKKFCAKSHRMHDQRRAVLLSSQSHAASTVSASYHTRVECCFHDSRRCLQAAVTPTGTLKQSRSHQDGNDLIGMTEVAVAAHLVAKLSPKCNPRAVAEYRYSVATAKNRKHHRTPKAFYFGWRECDEAFVFVCCFAYLRPVLPSRRYCMAGSSSQVLPPGATKHDDDAVVMSRLAEAARAAIADNCSHNNMACDSARAVLLSTNHPRRREGLFALALDTQSYTMRARP